MTKLCLTCHQHLPLDAFRPYKTGKSTGLRNHCIECVRARQRSVAYHTKRRISAHLRLYKLTSEHYARLLLAQDGKCAICLQPCRSRTLLCVDHDHDTGAVRGLLCSRCNAGLGQFQDSPDVLARARAYLRATKKGPSDRAPARPDGPKSSDDVT
jgi:hypothetical protein